MGKISRKLSCGKLFSILHKPSKAIKLKVLSKPHNFQFSFSGQHQNEAIAPQTNEPASSHKKEKKLFRATTESVFALIIFFLESYLIFRENSMSRESLWQQQ